MEHFYNGSITSDVYSHDVIDCSITCTIPSLFFDAENVQELKSGMLDNQHIFISCTLKYNGSYKRGTKTNIKLFVSKISNQNILNALHATPDILILSDASGTLYLSVSNYVKGMGLDGRYMVSNPNDNGSVSLRFNRQPNNSLSFVGSMYDGSLNGEFVTTIPLNQTHDHKKLVNLFGC